MARETHGIASLVDLNFIQAGVGGMAGVQFGWGVLAFAFQVANLVNQFPLGWGQSESM